MITASVTRDLEAIQAVEGLDTILSILRELTQLRVILVARVQEEDWTACAVLDDASFGVGVGQQLDVATTY